MRIRDHVLVVISVIARQALGMVWYSPDIFGNRWLQAIGKTSADLDQYNPAPFVVSTLATLFYGYLLLWLLKRLGAKHWTHGAQLGSLLGMFVASGSLAVHYSFIGYNYDLLWVDGGMEIVGGFLAGVILSKAAKSSS